MNEIDRKLALIWLSVVPAYWEANDLNTDSILSTSDFKHARHDTGVPIFTQNSIFDHRVKLRFGILSFFLIWNFFNKPSEKDFDKTRNDDGVHIPPPSSKNEKMSFLSFLIS